MTSRRAGVHFGWLQDDYQIVDRIREAIEAQGAGGVLGLGLPVLDLVRSVVTAVVAVITIVFLTFFMLLEGPRTIRGVLDLLAPQYRVRYERVGNDIYKTISGYVTGNLLISLVAGVTSAAVLFGIGSEFAIALGLLVGILDLIPLAGATLAAIIVSTIVLIESGWLRAVIVIGFFLAYQQLETRVLQPLVYGRTVQLALHRLARRSDDDQLAGVLGALMAIPVAGTLLAIAELLQLPSHRGRRDPSPGSTSTSTGQWPRADRDQASATRTGGRWWRGCPRRAPGHYATLQPGRAGW